MLLTDMIKVQFFIYQKQRMQPFVSKLYGATFVVIYGMVVMGIVLELEAATTSSQLRSEAIAIMKSGWWNRPQSNPYHICSWDGIVCNHHGSITEIKYPYITEWIQLAKLNFSAFKNLERLDVGQSGLEGTIPPEIGNLPKLTHLDISRNNLYGKIPPSIGNLTQLKILIISDNNIQGPIPSELMFLNNLTVLDLSYNKINGTLPVSLTNLKKLESLDISHNRLVGSLKPFSVGNYPRLITIDVSHNLISGEVPPELGYFKNFPSIESLDLSHNNLTGTVTIFLQHVFRVNISFNFLKGPIPDSFPASALIGNKGLCSHISYTQTTFQFQPCSARSNKLRHKLVVVLPILIFLIMAFFLPVYLRLICIAKKNKHAKTATTTKNGDLFCIWNYDESIAYEDIITATEDFDMKYCIGTGAYGSVYRAQLPSGKIVALKKLHGFEAEVPALDESFRNEVKVLSEIKHRHIVKLYGFCLHKRIMFLIYEYMEEGSLFSVLYHDVDAIELDWRKRVKIVKGTADALSYLHHDCNPTIVHRDISASNVLLNFEWEPSVGDFGSFGVLALETLMGKHPKEILSSLQSVSSTHSITLYEILDQRLPAPDMAVFLDIVSIATIVFACLNQDPRSRPTMKHVSQCFLTQSTPLVIPLQEISLQQLMSQELELFRIVNSV